jgi:uncharacterized membrane protein YkvA (DUF1232 family)
VAAAGLLAIPFDVIPVLGYADDAIIVTAVLRSVVRQAGPGGAASALARN